MPDTSFDVQDGHVPASSGDAFDVQDGHVDDHGALATGAHYAAKALPLIGGFLGAIPGAAGGAAVGLPAGPGAIATTAIGAGLGAGAGAAAGKGLQHVIDTALGYEEPIHNAGDLGAKVGDMAREGASQGAATAIGTGVVGAVAPLASKLAGPLERLGLSQGRRVLTGGANTLSTKVPLPDEAVKEAFAQGAIGPLGTTQKAAKVLDAARENVGDVYGRIISTLEAQGIKGPQADALAQQYIAEGRAAAASTMNPAVPAAYDTAAAQISSKPVDAAGNLGLTQAESLKRSAQGMARSAYAKLDPDELAQAHEAVASMMRQGVEDSITSGAKASGNPVTQAIADQFVSVKQQLGNIIQASNAANKGAAQAAARRVVSPSDYIAAAGGGAPMAIANHVARTRGTATIAWAAKSTAEKLQTLAASNPARLGRYAAILVPALQKSPEDFNAQMYTLGQTDPKFQDLSRSLAEEKDGN